MSLVLTIGVTDRIAYLMDGTLRITKSCDDSPGVCDFTLVDYPYTLGDIAVEVTEDRIVPVHRYFIGNVTSSRWSSPGGARTVLTQVTAQQAAIVDETTPSAPFGLDESPDYSTTFPFRDLSIVDETLTGFGNPVIITGQVTCWEEGLEPGQLLTIHSSIWPTWFDSPFQVRIIRLTTAWLPGGTITYTAEFSTEDLVYPIRLEQMLTPMYRKASMPQGLQVPWPTPISLTAGYNDWNPTGLGTSLMIPLDPTAARVITGMVAQPAGTIVAFCNVTSTGGNTVTFNHSDAASAVANRFSFRVNADYVLGSRETVAFIYDGTASNWKLLWVGKA